MPYQPGISEFNIPKPLGQIPLVQTLFTPGYAENKAIAYAKEIRGGIHPVKYLSHLLVDNLYDGIFSSRREEGTLAYVKFLDDDTPHHKYYSLKTMPGLQLSDWELIAGTVLTPSNPQTLVNLAARDALLPTANKFVNVVDARTQQEISEGKAPYSRSFIFDGLSWLMIYGVGDVDPAEVAANSLARHNRNNDTQLKDSSGIPVTADQLLAHLLDNVKHREINDLNEAGASNELYSSQKTITKIQEAIANLVNLAPAALNTLFELAHALGNDPDFATTVLNELAKKFDKSGGTIGLIENGYIFRITNRSIENYKDEFGSSKLSFEGNTFRLGVIGDVGFDVFSYMEGTENDLTIKFNQIALDGLTYAPEINSESIVCGKYQYVLQGLVPDISKSLYWEAPNGQVAKVVLQDHYFLQGLFLIQHSVNSEFLLIVYQNSTGGKILTFSSGFKFPNGVAPPINTGPNEFTIYRFYFDGINVMYIK